MFSNVATAGVSFAAVLQGSTARASASDTPDGSGSGTEGPCPYTNTNSKQQASQSGLEM
jgi:hypothetical protein